MISQRRGLELSVTLLGKKLTAAVHRFTIREMAGEEKYMFEKDQVILSARCMKE